MPLNLIADVRPTETWSFDHVLGLLVLLVVAVSLVSWVRVRRRR
jgi:hypothetical protein